MKRASSILKLLWLCDTWVWVVDKKLTMAEWTPDALLDLNFNILTFKFSALKKCIHISQPLAALCWPESEHERRSHLLGNVSVRSHHARRSYSPQIRTNSSRWWGPRIEESLVRYSKLSMITATNRFSIWNIHVRRKAVREAAQKYTNILTQCYFAWLLTRKELKKMNETK